MTNIKSGLKAGLFLLYLYHPVVMVGNRTHLTHKAYVVSTRRLSSLQALAK